MKRAGNFGLQGTRKRREHWIEKKAPMNIHSSRKGYIDFPPFKKKRIPRTQGGA